MPNRLRNTVVEETTTVGRLAAARESALQEGLRRYQTMFERGALGQLTVDYPSFRIDVGNKALCTMTGYSADELAGMEVAQIIPADLNSAAGTLERLIAGTTDGYSVERSLKRRDASIIPVTSTVSAVRDDDGNLIKCLVLVQDLAQQRSAEQVQRRSQAVIDAAVAALPVSFTTLDCDLRLTFIAGGGLVRAGTRPGDFLGKHVPSSPATRRPCSRSRTRSRESNRRRARSSTARPT